MGGTTIRLRSSMPRIISGENSNISDMTRFLMALRIFSFGAAWRGQSGNDIRACR
jgi:hypothetical protein